MKIILLSAFFVFQLIANYFFNYGGRAGERWQSIMGYVVGNVFGASSIIFYMMLVHRMKNVNVVMTLTGGGTFLIVQTAMALIFHSRLNLWQWLGIAMVTAGMAIVTIAAPHGSLGNVQQ